MMTIDGAIAELDGLKGFLDDDCSTQEALDMAIEALEEKQEAWERQLEEDEEEE